MRQRLPVLFGLLLASLGAEAPTGFVHWTKADLQKLGAGLPAKVNAQKIASQDLEKWGNHWSSLTYRAGDGEAELHETVADIFLAEGGEATLVVGGKIAGSREAEKGELRGKAITGGTRVKLTPGDLVHIPRNTPHQLLVPKNFTYLVIKVAVK